MQGDRDLQQRAQALYRRQSEAEAGTFAGPGRAVRLVELLEHARPMLVRDARSRVPDIDAQSARLPARAHQHAAAVGVADRVADQVVEDARQHDPVAAHPCVGLAQLQAQAALFRGHAEGPRSEEHTSELQSLMRISYAVFCLKKKT